MSTVLLPITLTSAGAMALINLWLGFRVGQVRTRENVMVGDGGNDAVIRPMRAHANFVEYAPFVLALIGLIEFTAGSAAWLWIVAALFLLGRVAHPIGMDGNRSARMVGTVMTMLTLAGLGLYAIALPIISDRGLKTESVPAALPQG